MADETKIPKIDAVMCPVGYPAIGDHHKQAQARNKEFGPMLGCKAVAARHLPGSRALLSADPGQVTEYHPIDHPKRGQARYDWHDRGDGVMYGVLLPDVDTTRAVEASSDNAVKAGKDRLEKTIADLKAVHPDDRTAEQTVELAKAEAWQARLYGATRTEAAPDA